MEISQVEMPNANLAPSSEKSVSQDFETFLKMLTTQIQNQDPLSPMAADQFASQLATFSMVEQQTLTNQNIGSLINMLSASRISNFASVVGRFALHDGPFNYSGSAIAFELGEAPWQEGDAKLTIINERGALVAEVNLRAGQTRLQWDGKALDGSLAATGLLTAEVRGIRDNALIDVPVYTGGVVEEIQFDETGAELLLANGTVVGEADVAKLR
ncbi:flagellar hook assembly protein FlgD [Marivita sp.]|uniref:flagellar hook assembly protein FlgD n=1 Tax=Marivita sp. TaxID=2003365 RepID=UPI003F6B0F45